MIAGSDHPSPAAIDKLGGPMEPNSECPGDAYGGFELAADVAPDSGVETVLASYAHGVVVLAADGHRIAAAPGFGCTGSQDELVALEVVRTAQDRPVIALAVTRGGRRESSTWLYLFAVGSSKHLDRLFSGEVEHVDGAGTVAGGVTFVSDGLVVRHPTNGVALWKYDRALDRYVDPASRHD